MIRTLTARTFEIDEAADAVAEVLAQLDLQSRALAHSVGILSCYSEFVESGVVQALCAALPFPVVGTTTIANAAGGQCGQLMLALTVLTSDDVSFSVALSASIATEQRAPLLAAYEQARAGLPGQPALMFAFAPLLFNVGGDSIIDALDHASGGLPVFGTLACDHTADYSTAQVICNGTASRDCLAMVLVSGAVEPVFWVATLSAQKAYPQKAIITQSSGNLLQKVNGKSVLYYMESIGLSQNGKIDGISSIPFMVDFNDGTRPVVRAIFALTEAGEAVCGGAMPEGATLSVVSMETEDVLATSAKTVAKALASLAGRGCMLLYSCIGRYYALGVDSTLEMENVAAQANAIVPYSLAYSGGEICPVAGPDGRLVNRFHNDTLIACTL